MNVPDVTCTETDLNHFEKSFVSAVLLCQGVLEAPSEAQLARARELMASYAQQVQDNPPEGTPSQIIRRWLAPLSDQDRIRIAAAAFVLFGVTKPSIFQVRAAYRQILGGDLDLTQPD